MPLPRLAYRCRGCNNTIPEGVPHDCRQFQIDMLRAEVAELYRFVDALAHFIGVELPRA